MEMKWQERRDRGEDSESDAENDKEKDPDLRRLRTQRCIFHIHLLQRSDLVLFGKHLVDRPLLLRFWLNSGGHKYDRCGRDSVRAGLVPSVSISSRAFHFTPCV